MKERTYYHALNNREDTEAIKKEGFDLSKCANSHFGTGVYLFENKEDAEIWGDIVLGVVVKFMNGQSYFPGDEDRYFEVMIGNHSIDPFMEPDRVRDWMLENDNKLALTTENLEDDEEIVIIFDLDIIENIKEV